MKDMKGFTLTVGCEVARAVLWGKSPRIELCKVTRIEDDKMYLDDSKQPIRYPERLLIVTHDEVFHMMEKYELKKAV